ncbi:putative E3 ubiquitin-protein ligase MARCH10 [Crotalus adamanteus]|uniref:RING-type E3 ubiquitin transferase n=1 Tax=Crotalus adamanteus TaxID=8729 RepID=A0AAW1B3U7_CROAD
MQGFPKSILSRRQQMNQRNMLENPDSEAIRKAEGKGRKTPMLQGVAKITRGSEPQNVTAQRNVTTKDINKAETDPEKLKKLQESLLAEDPEEEGDQCRICQIAGGSVTNPLLEPCGCGGSLRFVHQECLKSWLKAKIKSGAELGAVKTCELCKQNLTVDLDDFNVNDYYRNHQQSRAQDELMNSGLYLVLLLHLYEQRFAELMRLNYNQASRDRLSRQPRTEENQNPTNSANSG